MYYILSEEEFKQYRECRSAIINVYNQMIKHYKTGNEPIDTNIERYAKILGIKEGERYDGI